MSELKQLLQEQGIAEPYLDYAEFKVNQQIQGKDIPLDQAAKFFAMDTANDIYKSAPAPAPDPAPAPRPEIRVVEQPENNRTISRDLLMQPAQLRKMGISLDEIRSGKVRVTK